MFGVLQNVRVAILSGVLSLSTPMWVLVFPATSNEFSPRGGPLMTTEARIVPSIIQSSVCDSDHSLHQ